MMVKRIIILALVCSMLLLSSTFSYAEEPNNISETAEISETNILENSEYMMSSINIDASDFKGQIKPANSLYDTGNGIYQTDSFASYYFSNLKDNFGNNTIGSCGYVATAMLLSYYDTYLNDYIIDNTFDIPSVLSSLDLAQSHSSPGIRRENDSLLGGSQYNDSMIRALDNTGYWQQLVENNYLDYFHLYLIKLAEYEFNMYHNALVTLEENDIIYQTEYPCACTLLMQKELIEHYLYNVKGLEGQVSVEYANTDVRNFTINKIKNGQPVILFLGSETGFHLVVAYDLNDNGTEDTSDDEIYAHYGCKQVKDINNNWKDAMHLNIDTDKYPWLVSALALNFNLDHSCSYNYTCNGEAYCSCFLMCDPDHEYIYTSINSTYHIGECIHCGHETAQLQHMWEDYSARYWSCRDCGLLKLKELGDKFPIIHSQLPEEEEETE